MTDWLIGFCYYFFSSLSLGWHFSQILPSLAAFTQHLWSHFFPASTVFSQQAANRLPEQRANVATASTSDLTNFIFSFPGWPTVGQHSVFLNSTTAKATQPWHREVQLPRTIDSPLELATTIYYLSQFDTSLLPRLSSAAGPGGNGYWKLKRAGVFIQIRRGP